MSISFRTYTGTDDYWRIDRFLIEHHQHGNTDGNWIEPIWEYMHFHPLLDRSILTKIGIWEDGGKIAGVVHPESRLGEAFFQFHHAYHHLREEMLDYAETNLAGIDKKNGKKFLIAYINDNDSEFKAQVKSRGYVIDPAEKRPMAKYAIPAQFPSIRLPDGYTLTSLAEECDWAKVNRVLWRGFNHPGDPPASKEDLEERKRMFDTPKASRGLKIAVKAHDGSFVSFCGMFYESEKRIAYVEPVATDSDFRRLGLGKAAVLEGIRRCAELGADIAYVWNDLPIYLSIGFEVIYASEAWVKYF